MKRITTILLFIIVWSSVLFAQRVDYPPHFLHLLEKVEIDFFEPLDAGYRDYLPPENIYHNCHFAMRSSREDLDIRFFVIPWEEDIPRTTHPHVMTFTTLTNIASNAEDAVISAIQPTRETVQHDFNADWGMTYFFKPKEAFSDKKNGRMIALCKEGKGTVFIFYLFNDPGNESVDTRYYALRFSE